MCAWWTECGGSYVTPARDLHAKTTGQSQGDMTSLNARARLAVEPVRRDRHG